MFSDSTMVFAIKHSRMTVHICKMQAPMKLDPGCGVDQDIKWAVCGVSLRRIRRAHFQKRHRRR